MTWWLWGCTMRPTPSPATQPPADLVIQADVDVVVEDGRITAVAPAGTTARVGPQTVVLHADRVTAGFVDAHAHPVAYGRVLEELDLTGAMTYAETLDRIETASSGKGWLLGRGWDQNDWPDAPAGTWPRLADLDARTEGRPTRLGRVDGHAVWVNQAALDASGITAQTPDPPGGQILRDAKGRPNGILIDAAMSLVSPPSPTPDDLRRYLTRGLADLVTYGLTGVHVMGIDDATLDVMTAADAEGALPMRLWVYMSPDSKAAQRLRTEGPWHGPARLRVQGVKLYGDGALGSRGALLSAPYADEPDHIGLALTSAQEMAEWTVALDATGGQVAIHAIGDRAVTIALDAIEGARGARSSGVRHRVEHAQVVKPEDVPRFATLRAIASVQPTHATSDRPWAEDRLGPDRMAWGYRWRSLVDAGAAVAFGSDLPVEAPSPADGLRAATVRDGWRIEEVVTLDEAIAAFTQGAAYAVGDEARLGSLTPGKLADLTLWQDEFVPIATVVEGEVVWQR
ncbi:MAG: amidohydrolase [Myxococcota bacterium]